MSTAIPAWSQTTIPVVGGDPFPVRRIYCVGRNYAAHAREMGHMVEIGMTPMQAIQAATRNGAEGLGLLDELGTIEKGKIADIIVVAGDPLSDVESAMRRVYAVIKGGVRYK